MPVTLSRWTVGATDYVATYNANATTTEGELNRLDTVKQNIAQKGAANGYPSLDATTRIPVAQLPTTAELTTHKSAANGYASLDSGGRVPMIELPVALQQLAGGQGIDLSGYQILSAKNQASGYAGLDASSKLTGSQLPYGTASNTAAQGNDSRITGAEQSSNKGAASGYCPLDTSAHVPAANLVAANVPDLSATYTTKAREGAASGVATLGSDSKIPTSQIPAQPVMIAMPFLAGLPGAGAIILAFLPTVALTIPANLSGTRCKAGTNPTATATLSVQKNGAEVATIQVATDGTITLSTQAAISLTTSDELTVVAPGSQDATLADLRLTIHATR